MQTECNRIDLIKSFEAAPSTAVFNQHTIAALRDCSIATVQRDRWIGQGIPFIKFGHSVRYRKSDVLAWLDKHPAVQSTTQADMKKGEQYDA